MGDERWADAKKGQEVCLYKCPVTLECLLANYNQEIGVWGGLLPTQRKRFAREARDLEFDSLVDKCEEWIAALRK